LNFFTLFLLDAVELKTTALKGFVDFF